MIRIGPRMVVAATCLKCGELFSGHRFGRHIRKAGEVPYIDRRCPDCKWGLRVKNRRRPNGR